MQRYVIADEFGRRVNTILWDGESVLSLGAGYFLTLESEFVALPNEGSPYHNWNGTEYALDPAKVEEAKVAVWEQIKAYRAERTAGGISVGPYWFHSDTPSKLQHLGLVNAMMMSALPANQSWKLMDGSFVTLTPTLVQQIFGSAMQREGVNFAKAEEHRVLMEASSDPYGYDFTTGWAPIYGE
jgi:hypothetical protein